jgi:hypothetical protein
MDSIDQDIAENTIRPMKIGLRDPFGTPIFSVDVTEEISGGFASLLHSLGQDEAFLEVHIPGLDGPKYYLHVTLTT